MAVVEGEPFLLFSCWPDRMDAARRGRWRGGGVWVAPARSLLGPWGLDNAKEDPHREAQVQR